MSTFVISLLILYTNDNLIFETNELEQISWFYYYSYIKWNNNLFLYLTNICDYWFT